jgi:hypothetical protein
MLSGVAELEYRPGAGYSVLFFVGPFSPAIQIYGLGNDSFLPNPFHFITHQSNNLFFCDFENSDQNF